MKRSKPPPQDTLFDLEHPPVKSVAALEERPVPALPEGVPALPTPSPEPALEVSLPQASSPRPSNDPTPEVLSQSQTWVGYPIACSVCREVLPTLRHLELLHDSHGEDLRERLLSAYLWPSLRARAEALSLSVARLRRVILAGGLAQMEEALSQQER